MSKVWGQRVQGHPPKKPGPKDKHSNPTPNPSAPEGKDTGAGGQTLGVQLRHPWGSRAKSLGLDPKLSGSEGKGTGV